MRRWARRIVKWTGAAVVLVVLLVAGGYLATQTAWFRNWARGFAEQQAARLLNGTLHIGRLDGSLWSGATLDDVRITQDGREVVRVDRIHVTYNARQLISRDWLFPEITLTRPSIVLIHDAAGWHIASLLRPRQNDSPNAQPVRLPSLVITEGQVAIEDAAGGALRWPAEVRGLDADLGLTLSRGLTDLLVRRATFETMQPALAVSSLSAHWTARNGRHDVADLQLRTAASGLSGHFTYIPPATAGARGTLDTELSLSPADLPELSGLAPALGGRNLVLSGSIRAQGPLDALPIAADLSDPQAGAVKADVVLTSAGDAVTIRGTATTRRLDLAPVLKDKALASRLTSSDRLDLTFTGPFSFDALTGTAVVDSTGSTIWGYAWDRVSSRVRIARKTLTIDGSVRAYGASATAAGTIEPAARPVRYALNGHLAGVDVRALPKQLPLPALESRLAGSYTVSGQGARLDANATFEDSSIEGADVRAGATGRFNNQSDTLEYGFAGHVTNVDVQRFGRALEIMAINADDYASAYTGELKVDGAGSSLDTLTIDATAQLEPSSAFDVRWGPADVTAHIAQRQLTASYRGRVDQADVGRLTGRENLAGMVAGTVDAEGTLADLGEPFDLGRLAGRASVMLDPSTVGPLTLDMVRIEGTLSDQIADITTFEAMGPQLVASANGRLALADRGSSSLKYNASLTRLADVGPLVGRMLDGRVLIDGTLTGNRADLVSNGTAVFSELKVDDAFDALTLSSTIEAHLPGLDPQELRASLKANATLVTVAGREIPTLAATVDYEHDRFRFDTTVNETGRTITASGDLALLENGREVTVNRASLTAGTSTWALSNAGPVRIRYQDGLVTLPQPVTLVNNGQELSAEGTFALTDDVTGQMDVAISGVDMTALGSLLLSKRQLAGTLTGDARITGGPATRNVVGNVNLLAGIVDSYAFQSLDVLMNYRSGHAQVDAVLIQSPTSKLEATGSIPFSLSRGVLTDQPLTVDVASAGIDLAVLEAVNTGLMGVTGLLVVDAHVTGTGTAPMATGSIRVQQGAFTVAATGARYINATIDASLQNEDLVISKLSLTDDDGHPLEGNGRLHVENRTLRDIEFVVTGRDFLVLNNDLGHVAVDASLNLYGTITAPKVAGLVTLHTARLEVDQIADRFGSSPYQSEEPEKADKAAAGPDETSSMPLALNLSIRVPDNLVLRGHDIRIGTRGTSLGDINLTAGGDFTLVREGTSDPVLIGTIATVRGTYKFQGRQFQVQRDGTITFRGEAPIDPALSVTAERTISGIVARVMVGGTMRTPELTLSSQPPLDQSDVLSLIVFNQPANRLGEGQATELGSRAAQMAGGLVAAPISSTLGRALNVDIFEIDPSGDEGEGPTLTIGDQVAERLFLKFRQLFATRDVSEFQLEYQLNDLLRLRGSFAEGQTSAERTLTRRVERAGIDLVVYFSY